MAIDLLNQLKRERTGRKNKRPFQYSLFHIVVGIVKKHRLSMSFLKSLDEAANASHGAGKKAGHIEASRIKAQLDLELFPLLAAEEYELCRSIIHKLDCPYLHYARSPDEMLLCNALYSQNPSLDPQQLANEHFETLLHREIANKSLVGPHGDVGGEPGVFQTPEALASQVDTND